ncbi:MAG: proteasome accessory factor PafA2 family protein, partial [Nitrospira sp.]|nr:proteasome accessory factor PafA2 family protein [Nitrospira sp.]
QDIDEARYFALDAKRELSFAEIKSDLVFSNGARFYNDHAHPEYCTPECASLRDLVFHDRAGERIVMACAAELSRQRGSPVRIYKNNTDFGGHSYGCHENYLVPRQLEWRTLSAAIQAFLVTRQIYAGAGKFGREEEDRFVGPGFQLAQRSDFFTELESVDTMQRRPLVNTRDEPHANPELWRRFHVIIGDANMSPFATWLKAGATALVLEAIARQPGAPWPVLDRPLHALRSISRDPQWRWEVTLKGGRPSTALEVQERFLDLARNHCDLANPERGELIEAWRTVLADLASDPRRCRDRLDWVAKRDLILEFQDSERLSPEDPWLRSLDLEYHLMDPSQGLFFGLEQAGMMRWVPEPALVEQAIHRPPTDTRAAIRGLCVSKFQAAILSAQWDHVTLATSDGPLRIDLNDLVSGPSVASMLRRLEEARSPDDLRFAASG